MNDAICAKNAAIKKMVELSQLMERIQRLSIEIAHCGEISEHQAEVAIVIGHISYADAVILGSGKESISINQSGNGAYWRLDKLLQ